MVDLVMLFLNWSKVNIMLCLYLTEENDQVILGIGWPVAVQVKLCDVPAFPE